MRRLEARASASSTGAISEAMSSAAVHGEGPLYNTTGSTGGSSPRGPKVSATHEFLVQHPGIDEHADRHVPIHRGLKFELHYQVQPRGIAEAYPPQTVASALAQVVAHELRGQSLERAEVQPLAPPSGGESAQQIFDHPWKGEQALVGGILHGCTVAQPLSRQRRRLSRLNGANGSRFVGRCPMRGLAGGRRQRGGGAFFRSDTVVKLRPRPTEAGTLSEANAESRYEITRADLAALSCPMPDMAVWNSHPKVYLPVEETGEAKCPYCGAEFRLSRPLGRRP